MASIRQIKTSKGTGWVIDYYDHSGTRKRKTVYCGQKKAEQIAKALEGKKARIDLGLETPLKKGIALHAAIDTYLKIAKDEKKETTIKREKLVYNSFQDYLGEKTLIGNIRRVDIANYKTKRFEKDNLQPATIDIELRILRQFFNVLIQDNYLDRNPCKGVSGVKAGKSTEIRFLTISEIEKLLNVIDDQNYEDVYKMYLHTGARKSELLADHFTWDAVDFQSRQIRLKGKGDKTRWVPMNETAYNILKRRKEEEQRDYPFDFDYWYIYKKFKRYVLKAGLDEEVTLHTLRKTYGSLLVQNGVDIFTVSKLLGHSTVRVTEEHYADLLQKNLADGVQVLDNLF